MIIVQHKNTLEVRYISVGDWMETGAYQASQWKLLDIENTVRLCYKGRYAGIYDSNQAMTMAQANELYTCKDLTLSDYFILTNRIFYQGWQKVTNMLNGKHRMNML